MKKVFALLFTVMVLTVGLVLFAKAPSVSAKAAPDAALVGMNTEDATIHELAGEKPLFINFWATWCPPCVGEMPTIEAMYQKYGDQLNFAAITVDEDTAAAAAFLENRNLTLPVYTGDLHKLGNDYQLDFIPRSVLIGTDGSILAEYTGGMNEAALEAFLSKAF